MSAAVWHRIDRCIGCGIAALVSDQRYGYSGRQAECVVDELVERQGEQFLRELATVLSDTDFQEAAEATFDVCA